MKIANKLLVLLCLVMSVSLISCGNSEKNKKGATQNAAASQKKEQNAQQNKENSSPYATKTNATFKDSAIAAIYTNYVAIKTALVETDAAKTEKSAQKLADLLKGTQDWKGVMEAARKVSNMDNINKQREYFSALTDSLDTKLEGSVASGKIYKQFCPMAFNGKGAYWFSNSEKIYNPYFGEKMMDCGRTEKTLQ